MKISVKPKLSEQKIHITMEVGGESKMFFKDGFRTKTDHSIQKHGEKTREKST